jgi:tetratricopeptide (TPR) repeat protein
LSSKEAITRAEWSAKQAINFGPNLAESHNALGSVLLKGRWDWDNAEKEFRRAIALNPDYQPAHLNYSTLLAITGRTDEALKEGESAMNLDPFAGAAIMNYCRTQYYARQFDQADACLDRLASEQPNYVGGKYMHGIVYLALGRIQEATQIFEEIYSKDPAHGGAMLGFSYGLANRRPEAERVLTDLQEYQKQHYLPDQELGIIYLGLNDMDHAFPPLQKSVDDKYFPAQSFFFSPLFERVRSDPRYAELARSVKLSARLPASPADVSNSAR